MPLPHSSPFLLPHSLTPLAHLLHCLTPLTPSPSFLSTVSLPSLFRHLLSSSIFTPSCPIFHVSLFARSVTLCIILYAWCSCLSSWHVPLSPPQPVVSCFLRICPKAPALNLCICFPPPSPACRIAHSWQPTVLSWPASWRGRTSKHSRRPSGGSGRSRR